MKLAKTFSHIMVDPIDGLMQERRNSIANALELRLFCIKPSLYSILALQQPQRILVGGYWNSVR